MIQTNTLNCGTGPIGTWFDGCDIDIKDVVKVFLKKKNLKISLTDDVFDEDARAVFIKSGQLIPINDILQTSEAGAKPNVQTLTNKIKIKVSDGLYEFSFDFKESLCRQKSLRKLEKQNGWELLLLDSEGKMFFDSKNGNLNGFSVASIIVNNITFNDGGGKNSMLSMDIQLDQNGTAGFNDRRSFIVDDTLMDLKGIQDVTLESAADPATTSVKFNVKGSCDNSTVIFGIETSNVRVRKATDNSTVAGTKTYNATTGEYSIGGLTAGTDYLIDIFDSSDNSPVVDILNVQFYKSNVLAVTTAPGS